MCERRAEYRIRAPSVSEWVRRPTVCPRRSRADAWGCDQPRRICHRPVTTGRDWMLLHVHAEVYNVRQASKGSLVKKELRRRLRAVLTAIPPETLQERSRLAAERLFGDPEYQRAEVMMIYLALPWEVDTTAIVLQAWQDMKRVVAPQVSWDCRQIMPIEINNLDDDVAHNRLGFREPIRGLPIPVELIDLVIVPGLGFDDRGNRLGRGRGFYDRFLSKPNFHGTSCGFVLESQLVDSIPSVPHDVKIDMLVTDEAVRRFGS